MRPEGISCTLSVRGSVHSFGGIGMYRYAQEAGCRLHARAFVNVIVLSVVQAMAVPTQRYTWDQVPIGGGGAIPTVVAHPVVRDAVFTTHDVCGPYRYSAARSRFEYLCGQFDWSTKTNRQAHGTECLVVDPTDVTGNTIYATLGEWANVPEVTGCSNPLTGEPHGPKPTMPPA